MNPACKLLAADYIGRQVKQLRRQLAGARKADDIEYVHRARVAARRLRTALKLFAEGFPPAAVRRWRKSIRRVARALGEARDRDVQIEFLYELLCRMDNKEHLPGVIGVLVALQRRRRRKQQSVVKGVARFQREGTLGELRQALRKLARSAAAAKTRPAPSAKSMTLFGRRIRRRLKKMLDHEDSLNNSDQCERHHAMRIAVKRLRYALEICRPLYAGRLEPMVEAAKRAQTLLGEVHDCDVWLDELQAIVAGAAGRLMPTLGGALRRRAWLPGVEMLREDRAEHRRRTFAELAEFWAELRRRRLWDKLQNLVG
jgi:CHAD domain-containing protein